jgi:Flp pilus assembly protein TadD
MTAHLPRRPEEGRSRARRLSHCTAVSALALVLGLSACATTGPATSGKESSAQKSTMLLKIADETDAGGDYATAASLYRELHEMSPKDPVPVERFAAALMAMQDYRSAAQAYRVAMALNSDNPDLRRGLALALLLVDDPQGAMSEARAALAKHADDPRLYNILGVAQDMVGRHDLAQQTYRHGLEVGPGNKTLQNNYAISLALAGDFGDAVTKLQAIAGTAGEPRYRLNLALAYGLAGDDAKAAAAARDVLDESSVQNNLAYYALLRGMDEQHRTAAIIGAELHGAKVLVADAPVMARPAMAQAAPAPAPIAMAAASPLPSHRETVDQLPLLPTESSAAERPVTPRHVAAVADRPAAKSKPTSLMPEASAHAPATSDARPAPHAAASALSVKDAAALAPQVLAAPMPQPSAAPAKPKASAAPSVPATSEAKAKTADPLPEAPLPDGKSANPIGSAAPETAPGFLLPPPPLPPPAAINEFFNEFLGPVSAPSNLAALAGPLADEPMPDAAHPPRILRSGVDRYSVQLGSFIYETNAQRMADDYAEKGVTVTISRAPDPDGREWYVARSGEFGTHSDADSVLDMIRSIGAVDPLVVHYRVPAPKLAQSS